MMSQKKASGTSRTPLESPQEAPTRPLENPSETPKASGSHHEASRMSSNLNHIFLWGLHGGLPYVTSLTILTEQVP